LYLFLTEEIAEYLFDGLYIELLFFLNIVQRERERSAKKWNREKILT